MGVFTLPPDAPSCSIIYTSQFCWGVIKMVPLNMYFILIESELTINVWDLTAS